MKNDKVEVAAAEMIAKVLKAVDLSEKQEVQLTIAWGLLNWDYELCKDFCRKTGAL